MGQDKAALLIQGEPLLARTARTVRAITSEIAIIGPPERAALAPGIPVIPDRWPNAGPLGGIATALHALAGEAVLVVGCDMPFLNVALLRYLIELGETQEAVVVRLDGQVHPLHAVYRKSCLPALEAQLAAGDLRVQGFLARLQVRYVEPPELDRFDPEHRSVFNANTPEEWAQALKLL
jgi:molybdopterin-guanine dinucleotide biosynthesis protein A